MSAGRVEAMSGPVAGADRPPADDPLATVVDTLVGELEALAEQPDTKFTCDDLVEVIAELKQVICVKG